MKKGTSIRIDPDLRLRIDIRAKANYRSLGQEISYLVEKALRLEDAEKAPNTDRTAGQAREFAEAIEAAR